MDSAMKQIGFDDSERMNIFKLVAVILHLGNLEFRGVYFNLSLSLILMITTLECGSQNGLFSSSLVKGSKGVLIYFSPLAISLHFAVQRRRMSKNCSEFSWTVLKRPSPRLFDNGTIAL